LSPRLRTQMAEHISFYKQHRDFIQSALALPLTPVEPLNSRGGTAAIQLSDRAFARNMIFIYNLHSRNGTVRVVPRELADGATFRVEDEAGVSAGAPRMGRDLLTRGLEVECPSGRARVLTLTTATHA